MRTGWTLFKLTSFNNWRSSWNYVCVHMWMQIKYLWLSISNLGNECIRVPHTPMIYPNNYMHIHIHMYTCVKNTCMYARLVNGCTQIQVCMHTAHTIWSHDLLLKNAHMYTHTHTWTDTCTQRWNKTKDQLLSWCNLRNAHMHTCAYDFGMNVTYRASYIIKHTQACTHKLPFLAYQCLIWF